MTKFTDYVDGIKVEIALQLRTSDKFPFLSDRKEFKELLDYYNQNLGKMLRPILCVAVCDALGGNHEEAVMLGSAVEQIHGGSLMHDDVIDGDLFRRNAQSIPERFGVIPAILLGDNMMSMGLKALGAISPTRMGAGFGEFVTAVDRLSTGASKEHTRNPWDRDEYIFVLRLKTATAFRAAARLGAITAGASEEAREIIGQAGENIGVAFQIADDITDIQKSISTGEPTGDMKEGKVTLPIIYLYKKYPEFKDQFANYVHGVVAFSEIPDILAHINEGIMHAHEEIDNRLGEANQGLKFVPMANGQRYILEEYGRYAVRAILEES